MIDDDKDNNAEELLIIESRKDDEVISAKAFKKQLKAMMHFRSAINKNTHLKSAGKASRANK